MKEINNLEDVTHRRRIAQKKRAAKRWQRIAITEFSGVAAVQCTASFPIPRFCGSSCPNICL